MRTKKFLRTLAMLALLPLGVAAENEFNYSYFDVAYLNNGMDGTVTAIDGDDRVDINIGDVSGFGMRASFALDRSFHVFAGYSGSNMDLNATHSAPYPTLDQMGQTFFLSPGAENWDGMCDLNGDNIVNFLDLQMLRLADSDTRVASRAAVDGDMTDLRLGFGYHRLLNSGVDGYAQLFWDSRDLDFASALFMGETRNISAKDHGVGATVGLRGKVRDRFEMSGHVTYSPVAEVDHLAAISGDVLSSNTLVGIGGEYWLTDAFSICAEIEGDADVRAWLIAARYQFKN